VIEPDLSREWTAFGGASLALMGAALAAGARGYARDNIAWQRERSRLVGAPEPAADGADGLIRLYRGIGGAAAALGLAFVLAAAAGRALAPRTGPADARIAGVSLTGIGLGFAAMKARRGSPHGERGADLAVWLLCALWAAFGLRLLIGGAR